MVLNARLERHDQQRRNMMADLAHELRTPLTVIQGRVEGLLDGVYPRDDAGLELVLEETRVLARLIDDLRTLALSEAGALRLEREPVDVAALARDVAEALSGEAAARRVSIHVRDEARRSISIDPVRIREVLTNVISNAVRYSAAGGTVAVAVTHRSTASEQGDNGSVVAVAVTDNGAGMSAEEAARAFDRFYKGPQSHGSGLGLAIAQGLVVAHGGTISIDSAPAHGTTITVMLPANGGGPEGPRPVQESAPE
jgi:signal transduction histidine kinase